MEKILFLGGSKQQIAVLEYAKSQGHYIILCDYLKDNPGQYYADEYYCVSTTDKEAVLEIARQNNIHGIVAYSSEPAAATAAYVGTTLNLPSNPYESVEILSNKNLFREFLEKNGFNCPKAKSFSDKQEAINYLKEISFPVMVKPVDSSGSRGVSRIASIEEFDTAFNYSKANSKKNLVIMEEYIEMDHDCMIGGDIVVVNGVIEFFGFLNGYRDIKNDCFIPFGNSYPVFVDEDLLLIVKDELQRLINSLKITMGVLNLEVLFDKNGVPYIIELAARNGGNMISKLIEIATGVDLAKVVVDASLNKEINVQSTTSNVFYSTYYVHSFKRGLLKEIQFNKEIEGNIFHEEYNKKPGDEIQLYDGLNKTIAILFLKFKSLEEMKDKMMKMNHFVEIQLEEDKGEET